MTTRRVSAENGGDGRDEGEGESGPLDTLPFHTVQGLKVPAFVTPEAINRLRHFKLYPEDLWIVTFPKCGTTWTSQIVRLIRSQGVQEEMRLTSAVPWLEGISLHPEANVDELPRPRAYTSHFPYDLLPCGPPHATPCRYIYVMRNPKDVAVSLYFFTKLGWEHDLQWEDFWRDYVEGSVMFGSYFDHLLSWWSHRHDERILLLKYEDIHRDTPGAITRIASFIGETLSEDLVAKIAGMVTFKSMQSNKTANFSWMKMFRTKEGEAMFMRKGVVGDWKRFLTPEQSAEIDAICNEKLKPVGLEFEYV